MNKSSILVAAMVLGLAGCQSNPTGKEPTDEVKTIPTRASGTLSDIADEDIIEPEPYKGPTSATVKLATPHVPSTDLSERVLERWALILAKRGQEAFDYLSPAYRSGKDPETYAKELATRPLRWKVLGIQSSNCAKENACEITVWSESEITMAAGTGATGVFGGHIEEWLKIDGTWYYLPNH
jgi:hypothetical protein